MEVAIHTVSPNQLLLDPNNYRFQDLEGYRKVVRNRYAEAGVQERALRTLSDTPAFNLRALRESIISNGFVPFEQIAVEKMPGDADPALYVVIEGNRRVAAIKTILADERAGAIDLREDVAESLRQISVLEVQGTEAERSHYQKTLMAIRHVAGIKEWGPYQQARLVVEMYEGEEHNFAAVAQRIGITSREVARRYRASKALEQMEGDEEFGQYAVPQLYSFFHEAVSQPKVRDWLGWSDANYRAENAEARRLFYELMSPREVDGAEQPPKLRNANQDVRKLKEIVDKPVPLRILADPDKTFDEAVAAAEKEEPEDERGILAHSIKSASQELSIPSIEAWLNADADDKTAWEEFIGLVDKIREFMKDK